MIVSQLLFADALYFSSPEGSESRLVGKGFLMNTVHDPDNFLDLLVTLQHRIGAPSTTRRYCPINANATTLICFLADLVC